MRLLFLEHLYCNINDTIGKLAIVTNLIQYFCNKYDTVNKMLKFDKLLSLLQEQGKNKYYLRQNGINPNQLDKMLKTGDCGGKTINRLCEILHCQPGDIMEYVPDD